MDRTPYSDDWLAERQQDRIDADEDAREEAEDDEDWEDDEEEDWEEPETVSARGEDGRLRLLTEKCSTCVFRPGNLMHLEPGRLRSMIRGALAGGGYITCHQTLPYGEHPDFGGAICRGFYDAHGHQSNLLRIMGRLSGLTKVTPPTKEDTRA